MKVLCHLFLTARIVLLRVQPGSTKQCACMIVLYRYRECDANHAPELYALECKAHH